MKKRLLTKEEGLQGRGLPRRSPEAMAATSCLTPHRAELAAWMLSVCIQVTEEPLGQDTQTKHNLPRKLLQTDPHQPPGASDPLPLGPHITFSSEEPLTIGPLPNQTAEHLKV